MIRFRSLVLVSGILAVACLGLWACQGEVESKTPQVVAQVDNPSAENPAVSHPRSENAMPDFELQDLAGNPVRLSDYEGKAVLINFWATWCGPCRAEIPELVKIQKEYGGSDFTVIGISLDQGGFDLVQRFVNAHNLNYPILMGNRLVVKQYGNFQAIPATFLLNSKHELARRYRGLVNKSMIVDDLEKLFEDRA